MILLPIVCTYVHISEGSTSTKRLTIELSTDQYELLQKQAKVTGTSVTVGKGTWGRGRSLKLTPVEVRN